MKLSPRVVALATRCVPGVVLAAATLALLVLFESRLDGHRGHMGADYEAFLPRLLADDFWFVINGWTSVPWFSPAFCGGMPEWADPQSMPFSVPQWLTALVDPVRAVQVTFALFAAAGASGTWVLLRAGFRTSIPAALFGSVLFLFNGFYTREMLLGHLTYHPVMLTPWVAWLLVRDGRSPRQRLVDATLAGGMIALMIHAGMVALLIPVGLSWVAIGLLHSFHGGSLRAFFMRLTVAVGFGAALGAGKLVAMGAFASHFPRDFYFLGGFGNVFTLLRGAFRSVFLHAGDTLAADMVHMSIYLPPHEWENGLTPIPLLILTAAMFTKSARIGPPSARRRWIVSGLVVLCLIPLAVNLYTPGWNSVLKHLPVFRSSVTLLRWFFFYVPFVVVLTATALDHLPRRRLIAGLGIIGVVAWTGALTVRAEKEVLYDPRTIVASWHALATQGVVPSIENIDLHLTPEGTVAPPRLGGGDDVARGSNQVSCYDPIFGYALERLPWRHLHAGSPLDEADGLLNLENPICMVFPNENRCRPGDPFPAASRDAVTAFLDWGPLPFRRPLRQQVADIVSLIALVVLLGVAGGSAIARLRNRGD